MSPNLRPTIRQLRPFRNVRARERVGRRRISPVRLVAALTLVLALAAGIGVASGAIPSGGGVINGCYHSSSGQLRVIDGDAQSCKSNEKALDWNQQGVPGAPGQKGEPGPPGPAGTSDAFVATGGTVLVPGANDPTKVLSLALPAGNYTVAARTNLHAIGNGRGVVECFLLGGANDSDRGFATTDDSEDTVPILTAISLSQPSTIELHCVTLGSDALTAEDNEIIATPVDTLHES
jgi:hypothetical protein